MNPTQKLGPLIFRYGSGNDRSLLSKIKEKYDYNGVVINGHIAAYNRASVTSFLTQTKLPYFIDPVTWLLARDFKRLQRDDGKIRKSIVCLTEIYGEKIKSLIEREDRTIEPRDFKIGNTWNHEFIKQFVEQCLQFQSNYIEKDKQQSLTDLLKLAGDEQDTFYNSPQFLVTPYFLTNSLKSNWYKLNLLLAEAARKYSTQLPIYGVICIYKDILLDEKSIDRLTNDWQKMDGILLIIDKFKDFQPPKKDSVIVKNYIQLVKKIAKWNTPIYTLYGGYPSLLLTKIGLSGVCSGICFGEWKNIEQARSKGKPQSLYYLSFAKQKRPLEDARRMYYGNFQLLCDCSVCRDIKSTLNNTRNRVSDYFNKIEINPFIKLHYAMCRISEVENINKKENIIELLDEWDEIWENAALLSPEVFKKISKNTIEIWQDHLRNIS